MSGIIKKLISGALVVIMALYGFVGMSSNVSNDYAEGKYKNVILMIGDGMGDNTLEATKAQRNVELTMETMPVRGHSDIDSFLIPATDSAAGATALSCGIRAWTNSVAVYPFVPINVDDTPVPITLAELAKANGKAAGVVTTDETSGATPSAFSAHVYDRKMEEEISADQLVSGLDLIWGGDSPSITAENTAANGFTYIDSETKLNALTAGSRSFAQFNFDDLKYVKNEHDTPTLEEMTKKAIEILSADEDGFFLMVEGACIDKFSHSNIMDGCTLSTVEFDKAVAAALDFAKADGETLVVVTADHETGGIKLNKETGEYYYTSDTHTLVDVPLFVSATDAGFADGEEVKNREISVQIARVMGYGKDQFPAQKIVD
ncbi:MAG: alkaline phosphatase [Clostridia bacterium]|nr:alkaline phosphatase [Clostridia bacterium]